MLLWTRGYSCKTAKYFGLFGLRGLRAEICSNIEKVSWFNIARCADHLWQSTVENLTVIARKVLSSFWVEKNLYHQSVLIIDGEVIGHTP
jgi:hypothetical protein